MGLEIRKVPKWDKAKIDDKLLILRQEGLSCTYILLALMTIIGVISMFSLIVSSYGKPTTTDLIFAKILIATTIALLILGMISNYFYTRRTD